MELVMPYFVVDGKCRREPIKSMPGIFRLSIDNLLKDVKETKRLGIKKVLLFGVARHKDDYATDAYAQNGVVQKAVTAIKKNISGITVITDVCLCAYTTHGHCRIIKSQKSPATAGSRYREKVKRQKYFIDNNKTLDVLADVAVSHAEAGADFVAPSAMMPHQVKAIRVALDKNGFKKTKILAYSAKFASNFYRPFRDAVDSGPKFGDRSGYQLDFKSDKEALARIAQDIKEGADIVMVKPALAYLDIISQAKDRFNVPIAAYNVSGEYALIRQKPMILEVLAAIKRAGADLIITYHAKDIAKWLKK